MAEKFRYRGRSKSDVYRRLRDIWAGAIKDLDPDDARDRKKIQIIDGILQPLLAPHHAGRPPLTVEERAKKQEQTRRIRKEARAIRDAQPGKQGREAALKYMDEQFKAIKRPMAESTLKGMLNTRLR